MSNTKVKEAENEVLDYLLDNWGSTDTEVKINYLRLLVKKYYQEREKYEHNWSNKSRYGKEESKAEI